MRAHRIALSFIKVKAEVAHGILTFFWLSASTIVRDVNIAFLSVEGTSLKDVMCNIIARNFVLLNIVLRIHLK